MRIRTVRRNRPALEALEGRALLTAGALDTTFGNGQGYVTTNAGGTNENADVVAVEPWDGKIVVASHPNNGFIYADSNLNFTLIRYNTDGSLDTTFGNGGIVTTDFNGGNDQITALAFDTANHKIDAVGNVTVYLKREKLAVQEIGVARYNANGSLDTTFGSGGKAAAPFSTADSKYYSQSSASAAALDTSGRLVIAGGYSGSVNGAFVYANGLARFNPNGSLDTTFGSSGVVVGPIGAHTYDNWGALDLEPAGTGYKIDVAGQNGGIAGTLAQYNSNGTRDTTFGNGGAVTLAGGGGQYTFAPNGDLIVTSEFNDPTNSYTLIGVTGYDPAGGELFHTTVDISGLLPPNMTHYGIGQPAVAVDASGRIVLASSIQDLNSTYTTQNDSLLIRLDSTGNLDTTFGNGGVVITDFGPYNDGFSSVAIAADGSIIAAGNVDLGDGTTSQFDILVARYQGS